MQVPATTAARFPREVYVLSGIAFLVALGFGVIVPVIPVFARTFDVSAFAAGAVVAAFAAARLIAAPISGPLVNRVGERLILGSGVGLVAVSSGLAGLSQSYTHLLVLRGAGGVGSAMFTVSAATLLIRTAPDHLRGRATGVFGGGFLLGGVLGPLLGAGLAAVSLRAPFFFYAAVLLTAGVVGLLLLPKDRPAAAEDDEPATPPATPPEPGRARVSTVAEAMRLRAFRTALIVSFAAGFTLFGVRSSTVPLFVTESLGQAASLVGICLLVAAVANGIAIYPMGKVADQRGRRPVLMIGSAVAATGMVLLAGANSVTMLLIAMVVLGLGSGPLQVVPPAIVGDLSGRRSGTLVAAYQMAGDVGAIAGPLLAGLLLDASGYTGAFLLTAVVLVLAGLAGLRSPETLPTISPTASRIGPSDARTGASRT